MGVEGAVGQPRVRHERGDPRAIDAVSLESTACHLDDPPPRRLLVLLPVPSHARLHWPEESLALRPPLLYYDRNSIARRPPEMANAQPVALVTGASSGIGKAAALALVQAGFDVVGTSRNASRVTPHRGVTFLDLDVTSGESVSTLVRGVIERFGRIDVLVNNAGTGAAGAAEESSVAQDQRVFDINFFGLIRMTKAVLPHMRAQGRGRILNISSVLGLVPAPFMASYAATKHAIEGYSESLDHEVREYGIRVLLVEPAYTRTGFDANAIQPHAPLPIYAEQGQVFDGVLARAMADGDDPATVAKSIVAAATDPQPQLRRRLDGPGGQRPAPPRSPLGVRQADPETQSSARWRLRPAVQVRITNQTR